MPTVHKLLAAPTYCTGEISKGQLGTVTFIAGKPRTTNGGVNVGIFEKPELAQNIVSRLAQAEIVEFPNRYELAELNGKFGGCFMH
jgi:hypothetical protein